MLRFADTVPTLFSHRCYMSCFLPALKIVTDEILFKWAPKRSKLLRGFWEDYALVMETLEENQVKTSHITVDKLPVQRCLS